MKAMPALRLAYKLPLFVVGFGLLLTAVFVTLSSLAFERAAINSAEQQFNAMTHDRSKALQALMASINADAKTVAASPATASALETFSATWRGIEGDPAKVLRQAYIEDNPHPTGEKHLLDRAEGQSPYHLHHERFHPGFTSLMANKGYYDVFLINTEGDLVYSVFKEADYATNMIDGAYASSGLGEAFQAAIKLKQGDVYFADMRAYAPSNGAAAAFVATPVFDIANRLRGVLAIQIPVDLITEIVNPINAAQATLDVFVVGQDLRARSNAHAEDGFKVLGEMEASPQITAALGGEAQFYPDVIGSNGHHVASFSTPVDINGADWAVVAEQDLDELLAPVVAERTKLLAASIVLAGIMSLAGWLFARSVTRPIGSVCNRIEEVAQGELDHDITEADRNDEIGDIGKQLRSLQGDLKNAKAAEEERQAQQQEQETVVERLSCGLMQLASGDFSQAITEPFPPHHEKLRQNFNQTAETLSGTVTQVIDTAESIRNGAGEISQASDDLSSRTESQAATLEQTAAALDEMTASVTSAAEGARSVESIMQEAKQEAENSGEVVQNAVSAMTEIEQSSTHISQIIGVIDDIAFQTNLLA
uniref:methyl-accepting chemotaxis protein n=1 Tax=Phaeobacter sp. TaxID=1902409 RepID=UPI0025F11C78